MIDNSARWITPAEGKVFEVYREAGIRAYQCSCLGYQQEGDVVHMLNPFVEVHFSSCRSLGSMRCGTAYDELQIPEEKLVVLEVPWKPWMDVTLLDLQLNRQWLKGLRLGLPKNGLKPCRHAI